MTTINPADVKTIGYGFDIEAITGIESVKVGDVYLIHKGALYALNDNKLFEHVLDDCDLKEFLTDYFNDMTDYAREKQINEHFQKNFSFVRINPSK